MRGSKFSTSNRFNGSFITNPGPGAYNKSNDALFSSFSSPIITFPKDRKLHDKDQNFPGPGAYKQIGRADPFFEKGKYSMGLKHGNGSFAGSTDSPGPGAQTSDILDKLKFSSSQKPVMSPRFEIVDKKLSFPSPTSYRNVQSSLVNPLGRIGKDKKLRESKSLPTLGPGSYFNSVGKMSIVNGIDRAEPSKDSPKQSIGKSNRVDFVLNKLMGGTPGPADYKELNQNKIGQLENQEKQ